MTLPGFMLIVVHLQMLRCTEPAEYPSLEP
jgi:hypothetical protein